MTLIAFQSVVPYIYLFLANYLKQTLADFYFVVPEVVHILCSYTRQYECDDVLDGFRGPGDGCRSDTGSETVPGQIFAVWDSFAKICTSRK